MDTITTIDLETPTVVIDTNLESLLSAEVPLKTKSYSPIPHRQVIDMTYELLDKNGFSITKGTYRSGSAGKTGQANYLINHGTDPEMGLMVAWQNSYDKSMSFKFAIGAEVFICSNGMVRGDLGAYRRKHTGGAYSEATDQIRFFVERAEEHYAALVEAKQKLKTIECSRKWASELLGRLFVEEDILNTEQMSVVKKQLEKPSFDYGTDNATAWDMYNHVTHALKTSHPSQWMKNHAVSHDFFVNEFGILERKVKSSTNIFVQLPQLV
jgi:hypothetical protein